MGGMVDMHDDSLVMVDRDVVGNGLALEAVKVSFFVWGWGNVVRRTILLLACSTHPLYYNHRSLSSYVFLLFFLSLFCCGFSCLVFSS